MHLPVFDAPPLFAPLLGDVRIGLPGARAIPVREGDLPAVVRPLLVHQKGMTAVLEEVFGEPMALSVLSTADSPGRLHRKVLLSGRHTGRAAEIGLIHIDLDALSKDVADRIRAADLPFGTVLRQAGLAFTSRPYAFFRAVARDELCVRLGHPAGGDAFGRATVLYDTAGRQLAEAVEILAPLPAARG